MKDRLLFVVRPWLVAMGLRLATLWAAAVDAFPPGLARAWDVGCAALEAERRAGRRRARAREAVEFLPAALEVLETPPSPLGRTFHWTLMALILIGLGWSIVGELDVVAMAEGRTVAAGHTKTIQPMEAGVVRAIRVADGDHVVAGQVLIELDPTQAEADRRNLTWQLAVARVEAARFAAQLALVPDSAFVPPPGIPPDLVISQRRLLLQEVDAHRARLSSLDGEIKRALADRAAARTVVDKLERTVPMLEQRVGAKDVLAQSGYAPRMAQLELEEKLVEQKHELLAQRHRVEQTAAAQEALQRQRQQAQSEFLRTAMAQQEDAEKKAASLAQDLAKAEQRHGLQTLVAPISGTVQELSVHTEGGVVQQAQKLMSIVPDNAGLEIEARVLNRDIGFVVEGQEAAIKIEAFQYTKYGLVPGRVVSVSRDAVEEQRLGLVYPVRVSLLKTTIPVGDREARLGAGLTATVEIKTERRRIIEYLLSSMQKYRHEAMRER